MTFSVDYLERLLRAVEEFEQAFERWMETQVESDHVSSRGLFPTVWAKEGQNSAKLQQLELDVAETAGGAARAVAVTGAYIVVAGVGAIDPIANWSVMSAPKALITPQDVRRAAGNVGGRLRAMISDAQADTESGIPAFAPSQMHPLVMGCRRGSLDHSPVQGRGS